MGGKNRVLIVDGNEEIRRSLTLLFRIKSYETATAITGREALAKASKTPFNVVLLDIKLADMRGGELISRLRELHPEIAVIVITAYAYIETAASALKDGAKLYLMKPLNMDLVMTKVEEALAEQAVRRKNRQDLEVLGEREEKFRMMAEIGRDIVFQCDVHGKITYCSRSVERILQFTQEEIIGSDMKQYIARSDSEGATEAFLRVLSGESVEGLEICIARRDGALVPLEISTVPIRKNNIVVGAQGMGRDITARKEAEISIRRRDAILEAVSFSALLLMKTFRWEEQIPEVLGRLGMAAEVCRVYVFENQLKDGELMTSQRYEWVREGITPQIDNPDLQGVPYEAGGFARWAREMEGDGTIQGHVRHLPKSEREVLELQAIKSIIAVPVFVRGNWWGFIGFDACFEERMWSVAEEEALKTAAATIGAAIDRGVLQNDVHRQKNLLEETFNGIHEGIGIVDDEDTIVFCNPTYASIFDEPQEGLVGRNIKEYLDDDAVETIRRQTEDRKAGKCSRYELPITTREGVRKFIQVSASPRFDGDGSYVGAFGAVLDITDRKNTEKALQNLTSHLQSVRYEERTRIAREIHDEVGQTMTALKMDISWLSNRLTPDDGGLRNKIESMMSLVESNLQAVKRISAELRPGLLDDLSLIAAMEWQVGDFERRSGIKCGVHIVPENIEIERDLSTSIFRVLREALTNVARHAEATLVEVRLAEEGDEYILSVQDDGKGINEDSVSDPQAFGLLGMREYVRPWKGDVKIKGKDGGGTVVTVTVPRHMEKG